MWLAERRIEQAIQEGAFEALAGRGRPLHLEENPFEEPQWRLAHHLLRSNGFAPPWLEKRKDLEAEIAAARGALRVAWQRRGASQGGEGAWLEACCAFRQQVAEINRRIRDYNLQAPSSAFHLAGLNYEREIAQVLQEGMVSLP